MRAIAFVLACVAFAALGVRLKFAGGQMRDESYAKHQETHNAGKARRTSHLSAEVEHLQSQAQAEAPSTLPRLALFLLAGNYMTDAIALPKLGHGQLALGVSRPEAGPGQSSALNNTINQDNMTVPTGLQTSRYVSVSGSVQENPQAQKSNPAQLTQLPRSKWPEAAEQSYFSSGGGDPTLKDTLPHLRKSPGRLQGLGPVMISTITRPLKRRVVDSAPPAPPPSPPNSGRRDRPGDGDKFYLSYISKLEAVKLLNDWIARAKKYCKSDRLGNVGNASVAEVNRKSLETLQELRSHIPDNPGSPREVGIGSRPASRSSASTPETLLIVMNSVETKTELEFYQGNYSWINTEKKTVLAFVEGSYSWQPQKDRHALKIHAMALSPVELSKEFSEVALRWKQLKETLLLQSVQMGVDLILPDMSDGK